MPASQPRACGGVSSATAALRVLALAPVMYGACCGAPPQLTGFDSRRGIFYLTARWAGGVMDNEEITSDDGPKCPYCGHVHSDCEDLSQVTSYHGNEYKETSEYECGSCCLTFRVHEVVSRFWESTPCVQPAAMNKLKEQADG